MKKLLFITAFLLLKYNADSSPFPMSYLGIEQGLSNNTVTTIFKDKFGFMWFGTLDGLNRFDGYTFKKFRNKINDPASLPENTITALEQDQLDQIWVGTRLGVGILDSKTLHFSRITYQSGPAGALAPVPVDKVINVLKKDSSGNMMIGSTDAGLMIYYKSASFAVEVPLLNAQKKQQWKYTVTALAILNNRSVWLVVDNIGLCRFLPGKNIVVPVSGPLPLATRMKQGPDGNLWISTNGGMFSFNTATSQLKHQVFTNKALDNIKVFDFYFDKTKTLWLATDGLGVGTVNIFGGGQCTLIQQQDAGTLSSNSVYAIYEDSQSRKWIGTLRGGISVIDPNKNQFRTIVHQPYNKISLVSNFTFSFGEDAGHNIWIGTDGSGISVWNRAQNTFTTFQHDDSNQQSLSSNRVSSIIKDKQNQVWVATFGGGVDIYDPGTHLFKNVPFQKNASSRKSVWKIYQDAGDKIWATLLRGEKAGVERGRLFYFDKAAGEFVSAGFDVKDDVLSMTDDGRGNLWLGSFKNLVRVNKQTGQSAVIQSNIAVRSLLVAHGTLFIGTHGKGLMTYELATGKIAFYNENNGLPNNTILNIENDTKGNIWMSTFNGLSKLKFATKKFENYYASDGLQSNQFYFNAAGKLSSGELLFGGIKGFNIFHPDSIRRFYSFPDLLITQVSIENEDVNANNAYIKNAVNIYDIDKIRLPYDKAVLSMEYVALEYSLPEKIQYAYYLQGWDKSWNYVNNARVLNYSRLSEGNYTLHIKATNGYGVWNTKEKIVSITVLPPWFRSWWAYLLYMGIISASVYGYIYYHKKENQLHYEVKLANLKVEQEKELNEKKIAFFTNISHEFRTPLTLIANPIKELLQNNGKNIDLIDLSSVYRNARRLLGLVDRLLLFRSTDNELTELKKEWVSLSDIAREVFSCFNNQAKAKQLDYQLHIDQEILACIDREKMEIVLFNLLSNALKFTPDHGKVAMYMREVNDKVEIEVHDSGHGISAETGDRLFEKFYREEATDRANQSGFGIGLFLAKKYVDIHNGHLSYTSAPGEGTVFKIELPGADAITKPLEVTKPVFHSSAFEILNEAIIDHEPGLLKEPEKPDHVSELMDSIVKDKPSVLVIDDDGDIRQYLRKLLKDSYNVYEAKDTVEGLEIVMQTDPDIIVCDVVIKEFSGIEFCSKLKDSPSFSHIPVILLTGSSSPEIKLKGVECGADDYITKPFENDLLVARIKSILKGRNTLKQFFLNEVTLKSNNLRIPEEYSQFLARCIALIEKHLDDENFSVSVFTREMGMSRSNLFRKVKAISGLNISEFIRHIKLRKAAELMIQSDLQIKEVAYKIGFQDVRYFREQFCKLFEMNPSDFIRKYRKTFVKSYNLGAGMAPENTR